jgi:glutamate-ammonia-ligase adenylyltransferase
VGWLDYAGARDLTAAWRLMWTIGQIGKLLSEKAIEPETLGQGGCSLLLRDTGAPDIAALTAQVDQTVSHAGDLVDQAVTIG